MKITDVKTFVCVPRFRRKARFQPIRGENSRSTTLVQIDIEEGISGFGSCSGNGERQQSVGALFTGMHPLRIDGIWDKAYTRGGHKEFAARGIGVSAFSGINVALWEYSRQGA